MKGMLYLSLPVLYNIWKLIKNAYKTQQNINIVNIYVFHVNIAKNVYIS